jgi:YD repeat-containing protein
MPIRTKSTKRVKREIVVPFDGEEMFIVPKRNGFGQPDMEGYVMAVGRGSNLNLGSTSTSTTSSVPNVVGLETTVPRPTATTTTTSQPTTTSTQTSSSSSPFEQTTSAPTTTTSSTPLFQTGSTGLGSTSSGDSGGVLPSTGTTQTPTPFDPSGAGSIGGGVAVGSGTIAGDTPVGSQTQAGATTILQPSTLPEPIPTTTSTPMTITYGTGTIDLPSGGTGTNTGVVYDSQGNVISSTTSQVPVTTTTSTTTGTEIPPMEIPTFPDLSSMNCTDLNSEIARLSAVIAVSRFPMNVANAYNNQLATAKTLYNTKCPIKKLDDTTLVLTPIGGVVTPPIGGGGGGIFGGGGGGVAPEEEVPQEVAPDESGKRIGLFLVLAIIGGLYYLTRKRS